MSKPQPKTDPKTEQPPKIEDVILALVAAAKMKPQNAEEAAQQEAALLGNGITLVTSFFIAINRIANACERQAVAAEKSFVVMDRMSQVEVIHSDEVGSQEHLNRLLDKKQG